VMKQSTEWEKIFSRCSHYSKLMSRIYKDLKNLKIKGAMDTINKCENELINFKIKKYK
jgi:hypothetical protein